MYEELASVYDLFTDDYDYKKWSDYYLKLVSAEGKPLRYLCECGCGTGSLTVYLAGKVPKMVASDLSEEMLRAAQVKARKAGVQVPFVCQDMRVLELPRKCDAVIACCDAVNYLLTEKDVKQFFTSAFENLKSGGRLAFDISSKYKLLSMKDGFFGEERDTAAYLWQNSFDEENQTVTMDITFFVEAENGLYRKFNELHTQRAHDRAEITQWLSDCGFENINVYGGMTFDAPKDDDIRLHFVAVKP